jgi:small-conductance mechanosensitive channel
MDKKGMNKWIKFSLLLFLTILVYWLFNKFILNLFVSLFPETYRETIKSIIIFFVILILNYLFVNFSSVILKSYLLRKGDKREVKLLVSVYRYFTWFFVIFITLSLLFKQIGSLITSIGLIGFGITFALQKPILNFVGWLTIIFTKAYKIGDIIEINNIVGHVYDIKIMYTSLAELNKEGDSTGKSASIPNEFILTTAVINFSKGTNYVWDEIIIPLTYHSNWKKASSLAEKIVNEIINKYTKKDINKMFKDNKDELNKPVVRININEKGIILKVRYFIDFNISNEVKTELNENLLNQLTKDKSILLGKTENIDDLKFIKI